MDNVTEAGVDALLGQKPEAGETWVLEFKAMTSEVPEVIRYRSLLKHALRTLRLKCVGIHGKPEPDR